MEGAGAAADIGLSCPSDVGKEWAGGVRDEGSTEGEAAAEGATGMGEGGVCCSAKNGELVVDVGVRG